MVSLPHCCLDIYATCFLFLRLLAFVSCPAAAPGKPIPKEAWGSPLGVLMGTFRIAAVDPTLQVHVAVVFGSVRAPQCTVAKQIGLVTPHGLVTPLQRLGTQIEFPCLDQIISDQPFQPLINCTKTEMGMVQLCQRPIDCYPTTCQPSRTKMMRRCSKVFLSLHILRVVACVSTPIPFRV